MGKDKVDVEAIVAKIVEEVRKQKEELKALNEKLDKATDAYLEGIKDGIAWAEKHK
jgi:hypothetical protein